MQQRVSRSSRVLDSRFSGKALRGRSDIAVVVAFTVLAAALRLGTLDVQSVWFDEASTMRLVSGGFHAMLTQISRGESTPPLYYVLVWTWTRVFGHGIFAFRSLSAIAGILTVPVVYLAGRRFSPAAGVWAAAFATVSPMMFYFSQESRSYGLFILLAGAAFVAWQRTLEAPDTGNLAWWTVFSVLSLVTHYFAVFLFLGEAGVLARRVGWRRLVPSALPCALVAAALVPLAISQRSSGVSNWIERSSLIGRLAQMPKQFLLGPYGPWGVILAPAAALLAAGAWVQLRRVGSPQRNALFDLTVVAVVATALPTLLAVTGIADVFKARNLVAVWPLWAISVAVGVTVGRPPLGAWLGAGLCAISVLVIAVTTIVPAYQRDDWRDAAHSLPADAPGGRLIVTARLGELPLSVYVRGLTLLPASLRTVSAREIDYVFLRTAYAGRSVPSEDSLFAPRAPAAPTNSPTGFRLASVRRTVAYATYRFLAPTEVPLATSMVRLVSGDPQADLSLQP